MEPNRSAGGPQIAIEGSQMANEVHLLVNLRGDYTDTALSAEEWQTGFRARASNQGPDAVGTLPSDFQPVATTINRDETSWNITGNWYLGGPVTATIRPDDWLNDQVAPAVGALWNTAGFSSLCRVRRIDCYPIGTSGRAIPAPPYAVGTPVSLIYKAGSEPVGSGTSGLLPLQDSMVASLRTQQIGRAGRGRMYLPGQSVADLASTGLLSTAGAAARADRVSTFLTACIVHDNLASVYIDPIVTGGGFSAYGLINQVRCGVVYDTQRRRRRSLPENYQDVAVPHP